MQANNFGARRSFVTADLIRKAEEEEEEEEEEEDNYGSCCYCKYKYVHVRFLSDMKPTNYAAIHGGFLWRGSHTSVMHVFPLRMCCIYRHRPLEHWDRWFESHSRYECLCAFILCLCCVCR
jgi:hypothetical protein